MFLVPPIKTITSTHTILEQIALCLVMSDSFPYGINKPIGIWRDTQRWGTRKMKEQEM